MLDYVRLPNQINNNWYSIEYGFDFVRLLRLDTPGLNFVPRAFSFSRHTHFLREKPWGRGWPGLIQSLLPFTKDADIGRCV